MGNETKTTADQVLETARELRAAGQIVTRHVIADLTGLPLSIVDDRIKYLVDTGLLHRLGRGIYEPAHNHPPPRPIYHAVLPDGTHKVEIGDDIVITLCPQEGRTLGHMMAGAAFAFHATELAYQTMERHNDLARQVARVGRKARERARNDPEA